MTGRSAPGRATSGWCSEPAYVASAAQLGYATTDYGNQGVTTERSLTWVGEATSAAGLYVGATRGRYGNTVHVVADGLDDARAEIVAALGRDRTDRGLSAGRALAEAGALAVERPATPVPQVAPRRPLVMPRRPVDPVTWRTEAELDRSEVNPGGGGPEGGIETEGEVV